MNAPAVAKEIATTKPTVKAYQELQDAYDFFNERLFGSELPDMLITLQRGKKTFGYFSPNRFSGKSDHSEIAMNPDFFAARSLCDTLSTLVHEMCHGWRFHCVEDQCRGGYHDRVWGKKMEAVGLMPSNTGKEGGKKTGQQMTHYIMSDGSFQNAVFELLKSGYEISWYDKYGSDYIIDARVDSTILSSWLTDAEGDDELIEKLTTTVCKANPLSKIDDPDRNDVAAVVRANIPQSKGASNRCKYTCTSCGINAWAKPGVRLGCGGCSIALVVAE